MNWIYNKKTYILLCIFVHYLPNGAINIYIYFVCDIVVTYITIISANSITTNTWKSHLTASITFSLVLITVLLLIILKSCVNIHSSIISNSNKMTINVLFLLTFISIFSCSIWASIYFTNNKFIFSIILIFKYIISIIYFLMQSCGTYSLYHLLNQFENT